VHISIANPDPNSPLPYYRGKALVEQSLIASGISCAILRPAALFGDEPILVNTIAWMLRRLPIFGIPGDGQYGIQPTFVGDLANLAVAQGRRNESLVVDAAGPERLTFDEFVGLIRDAVGSHSLLLHLPPRLALMAAQGLGLMLRDVVMTREEVDGLLANLLVSRHRPLGTTRFTDWLADASPWIGKRYLSELGRRIPSAT
jgi:NADH dehydrogenase